MIGYKVAKYEEIFLVGCCQSPLLQVDWSRGGHGFPPSWLILSGNFGIGFESQSGQSLSIAHYSLEGERSLGTGGSPHGPLPQLRQKHTHTGARVLAHAHAHTQAEAHVGTHTNTCTRPQAHAHTQTRAPTRSGTKTRFWRSRGGHRVPRLTRTGTLDARRPGPSLPAACPRTEPALAPPPPTGPATSPGGRTWRTRHRGGHPCSPTHAPAGRPSRLQGSSGTRPAPSLPAPWLRPNPPRGLIGCGRNRVAFGLRPQPGYGCEDRILRQGREDRGLEAETKGRWTGSSVNECAQPP